MPSGRERVPADVEVPDDEEIIVRKSSSGFGRRKRFHKPHGPETDLPACEKRSQYPNEDKWKRKERGQIGPMRTPCRSCYSEKRDRISREKTCPKCGDEVDRLPHHLRNDCEEVA